MAITPTQRSVGRLSVSMTGASVNGTDTISNTALLAICNRGPLYKLLSATYADTAAFLAAFAAAGGILSLSTDRPATNTLAWEVNAGLARLSAVDTGVGNMAIRVALSHTATK